jgi:hypothetical protein
LILPVLPSEAEATGKLKMPNIPPEQTLRGLKHGHGAPIDRCVVQRRQRQAGIIYSRHGRRTLDSTEGQWTAVDCLAPAGTLCGGNRHGAVELLGRRVLLLLPVAAIPCRLLTTL